jgi:hypothetical protein
MRDRYPEEMTIVLQHQFWDLAVTEHTFEVGLSFGAIPERLLVPFDSIVSFVDPSVQFGLKFEVQDLSVEQGANDAAPPTSGAEDAALARKPTAVESTSPVTMIPAAKVAPKTAPKTNIKSAPATSVATLDSSTPSMPIAEPSKQPTALEPEPDAGSAEASKVISIDAFRKKT